MSILIYVLPAIMDAILPAVFFMAQVSTAQAGASPSVVANFITTWALFYMIGSFLIGRVVTPRNAAGLIILSSLITAGLSIAFSVTTAVRPMYVLMAMEGIGMALFFAPFQVFMKQVGQRNEHGINRSVGLYTFSWSIGYAAGPFAAAIMWKLLGWQASHLICAAAAVAVGIMTYLMQHAAHPHPADSGRIAEPGPTGDVDYSAMPDCAWMGWVFSGLGCLAVRMISGLFPSSAAVHDLSQIEQGLTLFILAAVQACFGLWLGRLRWWMYRPLPVVGAGLAGALGLYLFSRAASPISFYMAAALFGLYSGAFFYYLVFHSLVHPAKSARYVAINEASVGLTSLIGPAVGGFIATRYALSTSYLLTAGAVLGAIVIQSGIHMSLRRSRPPSRPA